MQDLSPQVQSENWFCFFQKQAGVDRVTFIGLFLLGGPWTQRCLQNVEKEGFKERCDTMVCVFTRYMLKISCKQLYDVRWCR